MSSHTVKDIIQDVLQNMHHTTQMIKANEEEMETIREQYKDVIRYNTSFSYTDGFWDGFWYGSCLFTCIMGGMIYFLR